MYTQGFNWHWNIFSECLVYVEIFYNYYNYAHYVLLIGMEYMSYITTKRLKKRLGKAIVESVACYWYEVWLLKREEQRQLLAL